MNTNFYNIVKRIVAEKGEAILASPQQLKGLVADYAKDVPKPERLAFGRCIEYGFYAELKKAAPESLPQVKAALARRLHDNEGTELALCTGAVEVLAALVPAKVPETVPTVEDWVTVEEKRKETLTKSKPTAPVTENIAYSALLSKKDAELERLLAELKNTAKERDAMEKQLTNLRLKKSGVAWAAFFAVAFVVSVCVGVYQYNDIVHDYNALIREAQAREMGAYGPAGGIVLFVGGQSLEVAPASTEFRADWYDAESRCTSLTVNGIGGWRLPDKDELDAMYKQLKKNGLGGFGDDWYWSSSEGNLNLAWGQSFSGGIQYDYYKSHELSVRAVRAF